MCIDTSLVANPFGCKNGVGCFMVATLCPCVAAVVHMHLVEVEQWVLSLAIQRPLLDMNSFIFSKTL